jgi:phenylpyruvate tautomerase PptA (4-oxalocrotonate tautomerase family)
VLYRGIHRRAERNKEESMPDVLIEVRGDWLRARKGEFIDAIEDSIVTALKTPKDDKILRLIEHLPECFSIPRWAGERFTHIEITMFAGRSIETKRALYRALVENLGRFGVPANDVKIILIEVDPSNVGMRGGQAASDLKLGYEVAI